MKEMLPENLSITHNFVQIFSPPYLVGIVKNLFKLVIRYKMYLVLKVYFTIMVFTKFYKRAGSLISV